jgi:hypothetical protein
MRMVNAASNVTVPVKLPPCCNNMRQPLNHISKIHDVTTISDYVALNSLLFYSSCLEMPETVVNGTWVIVA